MPEKMSRRKLLHKGSEAIVAGGVGACAAAVAGAVPVTAAVAAPAAAKGVDYYEKLGLIPFINAGGTYTILSASTMPDEVQAAVALAAKKPVHLLELHEAAGNYLAGLTLGTAACITMGNKDAIVNIPTDLSGLKKRSHRPEKLIAMNTITRCEIAA